MRFFEIHRHPLTLEVVNFLLAAKLHVAYWRQDLHSGNHDVEYHIEPYLVVTCSGASVGDKLRVHFLYVLGDEECLAEPLGAYTKGIGIILKYVAVYEVLDD